MSKISQPHDSYIHYALSQPEVAKGFLKQFLPKKVLKCVDLNTLEITKETYIEPDLRKVITDVLFKVNINQKPGYLYLLLEHQATPDKLMAFRFVRYTVNLLRDHLEQHKNDKNVILPAVVPLLLYNGGQKYKFSTNFFDLFGAQKKLMEDLFVNGFPLLDFKTIPDERFREEAWSGVMGWALKHIHDRDLLNTFELFIEMFTDLIQDERASQFIATTLKYGMERGKIGDKERFFSFIKESFIKETGDQIMSLARQLKDEGRQEGRQEGQLEGEKRGITKGQLEGERATKLAIARKMLLEGMDPRLVKKLTDLPLPSAQIEQLENEDFKK